MEMPTQWPEEERTLQGRITTNPCPTSKVPPDTAEAIIERRTRAISSRTRYAWLRHAREDQVPHVNIVGKLAIVGSIFRISRDA